MLASKTGLLETARLLLESGARVNLQDKYGITALILAALCNHTEVVELLLKAGADVNLQDRDGKTALMYVSFNDYTEVVELLLKHNARVDLQDRYGSTALMKASSYGQGEVVELLLKAGAVNLGFSLYIRISVVLLFIYSGIALTLPNYYVGYLLFWVIPILAALGARFLDLFISTVMIYTCILSFILAVISSMVQRWYPSKLYDILMTFVSNLTTTTPGQGEQPGSTSGGTEGKGGGEVAPSTNNNGAGPSVTSDPNNNSTASSTALSNTTTPITDPAGTEGQGK
jgi:hypothetical protein